MPSVRFYTAILLLGLTLPALANPPQGRDNGQGHGKPEKHNSGKQKNHGKGEPRGYFVSEDRVVVRDFYAQNPSSLPPGLAKRGGNLPPGLAKRGGNLPPGLSKGQVLTVDDYRHLSPLPRELELRLPPPPHEVVRRIIGRDIVLVHEHTRKILDVMRDALPHP